MAYVINVPHIPRRIAMFFEFQMSVDILGRILRNEIHQTDLGIAQTFDLLGQIAMVDHIIVKTSTALERADESFTIHVGNATQQVNGQKAVIVQPLQLNLVMVSDLEMNGSAPTAPNMTPEIKILVDVKARANNGNAELQFLFDTIDFGIIDGFLSTQQKQDIINTVQGKFPTITRTIDTSSLQDILPGTTIQISNAGATCTSDGLVLILRVESGGGTAAFWTAFYNTYDRNLLGNRDWALLIDKDLLIPNIRKTLQDKLAGAADKFSLESNIDVSWSPQLGPIFDIAFSGEVIDACSCFFVDIDMDVDVTCTVLLQVPGSDTLRMHIVTDYDANDLEVFCCALTSALFWPVVGIIYMAEDKANFGEYALGYLIGPLGMFIATCVLAGNQSIADQLTKDGTCVKVDDKTVNCDQSFTLQMGAFGGTYHLTTVSAESEGPVLSGTTDGLQDLLDPELAINGVDQFAWGLGGSCNQGFGAVLEGDIGYANAVPGSILRITDIAVLDDPYDVYANVTHDANFITIHPNLTPDYLAVPYPCKLRLVTNGGIRIITLDAAQQITSDQAQEISMAAMKAKLNCYLAISPLPWSIGKYRWLPDPPPDYDIAQIWQVVVSEMGPQDKIEILGERETALVSAGATSHGIAQASLWATGGAALKEMSVKVTVGAVAHASALASGEDAREVKRHVALRQIQLVERSRIALKGGFETMALERRGGRPILTIASGGNTSHYDLRLPMAPARLPGLPSRNLSYLGNSLSASWQGSQFDVHDSSGKVLKHLKLDSRASVAAVGNRIYIANAEALTMLKLSGELEQVEIAGVSLGAGSRIGPAKVQGVARAIAVTQPRGHVKVYDVSDPKQVHELANYAQAPWFLNADRLGRLFVRLAPDGKQVVVYEVQQIAEI